METRLLEAEASDTGKRFDAYLAQELELSRAFAKQLIEEAHAVVNERPVKPH